jgi:hypothetical protein
MFQPNSNDGLYDFSKDSSYRSPPAYTSPKNYNYAQPIEFHGVAASPARRAMLKNTDSTKVREDMVNNSRGPVKFSYTGPNGSSSMGFSRFQKRIKKKGNNGSSPTMKAQFDYPQYGEPPGNVVGMRKNVVLNEWRKGGELLRKRESSKKTSPQSVLSRNAEINFFTGSVGGNQKEAPDNREVLALRKLGVMVAGSQVSTNTQRYKSPMEGGQMDSVQKVIMPRTKPEDYEIKRPWQFVDREKIAREKFKAKEFKRIQARFTDPNHHWSKPETDRELYKLSRPYLTREIQPIRKMDNAPWQKPERKMGGVRIYATDHAEDVKSPWSKGHLRKYDPPTGEDYSRNVPWDSHYDNSQYNPKKGF